MLAAELVSRDVHNSVFGMEFAVCILVRLLHSRDALDDIERTDEIDVHFGRIADKSDNCRVFTSADMDVKSQALNPTCEIFDLLFRLILFDNDYHKPSFAPARALKLSFLITQSLLSNFIISHIFDFSTIKNKKPTSLRMSAKRLFAHTKSD